MRPPSAAGAGLSSAAFTTSEALRVSRKVGKTPGSPNEWLQKHFDLAVNTRIWNTVVRLMQKARLDQGPKAVSLLAP